MTGQVNALLWKQHLEQTSKILQCFPAGADKLAQEKNSRRQKFRKRYKKILSMTTKSYFKWPLGANLTSCGQENILRINRKYFLKNSLANDSCAPNYFSPQKKRANWPAFRIRNI